MFSEIVKVYQKDEKFLVLNPLVPAWIVTNINGVLLLKLYAEGKSFEKIVDDFIAVASDFPRLPAWKFLEKANTEKLFEIPMPSFEHKPYSLNAVYLNMTDVCNLRCIYCLAEERKESFGTLSLDDYRKLLDEILTIRAGIEIVFTGGEPLMSPLTLQVAKYAKALGFRCKLMTNATLINEKNVDEIAELFENVKISVDGSSAETHDFYRGKGSFDKTMNAISLLQSRGVEIILAMVVTRQNMTDVSATSKKWGNLMNYQPLFSLGKAWQREDLYLTGREYYEVLANDSNTVPYSNIELVIKRHMDNRSVLKCAMGDGEISISRSGDVYPCQLLHNENFKVGNVKKNPLTEIYFSDALNRFKLHTVENIDKCRTCDFKLICGGSCQARHFSETSSLDKAGDFCEYEKLSIINGIISSTTLQTL